MLLQDIERKSGDGDGDDGVSLKDGVSRDRMMSVHDPEMRHGHKSSSRRFDGHKAAIVVDTDSHVHVHQRVHELPLWTGVHSHEVLHDHQPSGLQCIIGAAK